MMLLLTLISAIQDVRPTIIAKLSTPPHRNFFIIYYDNAFLFAGRHYGSKDLGGNTEPGLFVHSKQQDRWIQISAISTANGTFGKSTSNEAEARKKLSAASVSWNFTGAKGRPYIDQPLRTSGSIAFPDRVDYDAEADRYVLRYFSSWDVPSAEVVLYVARGDLRAALVNGDG
jgi:hypothetical protein